MMGISYTVRVYDIASSTLLLGQIIHNLFS